MSLTATVTGQLNLQDDSTNKNEVSLSLPDWFPPITGIAEYKRTSRELVDTDGVVAIPAEGVAPIKGFAIRVIGAGSITLKHDSNSNGIVITSGLLLFGVIDAVTIETVATQAVQVEYVFFQ